MPREKLRPSREKLRLLRLAANFILFQGVWFVALLAPPVIAEATAALALVIHFAFIALPREWRFIALVALVGAALDGALALAGVFVFSPQQAFPQQLLAPPLWLILLWANFAAILPHSLRWLGNCRAPLALALGAIVGPASYLTGITLSDKAQLGVSTMAFCALYAPFWALLCVALPKIARKICQ